MEERHEREQYFFDPPTIQTLADLMERAKRPCCLCAPMVGRELHRRGRAVRVLDVDEPITEQISVNLITVAANDGSGAVTAFGNATQQAAVFANVNTIFAQAGVSVNFSFRAGTYNNTFALTGTAGNNNPRPNGDLNTIVTNAVSTSGVLSNDPNVINAFLVRIVPGFSQTSDNTSNGLAFVGSNGVTYWGGANLAGFAGGQDALASVLAHEIGHNLGLDHIVEAENLMQAGGSANPGERLNATQIATARNSPFTVPVPEPAALSALALIAVAAGRRKR